MQHQQVMKMVILPSKLSYLFLGDFIHLVETDVFALDFQYSFAPSDSCSAKKKGVGGRGERVRGWESQGWGSNAGCVSSNKEVNFICSTMSDTETESSSGAISVEPKGNLIHSSTKLPPPSWKCRQHSQMHWAFVCKPPLPPHRRFPSLFSKWWLRLMEWRHGRIGKMQFSEDCSKYPHHWGKRGAAGWRQCLFFRQLHSPADAFCSFVSWKEKKLRYPGAYNKSLSEKSAP